MRVKIKCQMYDPLLELCLKFELIQFRTKIIHWFKQELLPGESIALDHKEVGRLSAILSERCSFLYSFSKRTSKDDSWQS